MPELKLMGKAFDDLSQSLELSRRRHGLITGNIANIETPDYHTRDLDFRKSLNEAMHGQSKHLTRTNGRHYDVMSGTSPEVKTADSPGVDIDKEMANLSENNLVYRTGIESLLRKFALLKYAITEGGR